MRRGSQHQDKRFVANEWSPGYLVSSTSRIKGLPPARGTRETTALHQRRATYAKALASSQNNQSMMSATMHIASPSRPMTMAPQLSSQFANTTASPLRSRLKHPNNRPIETSNQVKVALEPQSEPESTSACARVQHPVNSISAQEEALRLISARGDNPFVKPLQKIVDLRQGIRSSRIEASRQRRLEGSKPDSYGESPPVTPTSDCLHAEDAERPFYNGTLARDPSAEFTLDVDGDGDVDEDEQKHANKVGRFAMIADMDVREALRVQEGKMVLAGVFINSHRHNMHLLDPKFRENMTSREMNNMLVDSPDFSNWMDRLKESAASLPVKDVDADELIANYLDIDGDGAIDASELIMQHRIGRFKSIINSEERLATRMAEGQYVYAQDFVWENRDILWKVNPRWTSMTQREIIDELLASPNYQGTLSKYRTKAQAINLSGSKTMRSCLGGSKNYMPDKAQMVSRRVRELNHACEKKARDFICEKVDLEATFRKQNIGYGSPSGWGRVYMANLAMLRGGLPQPGKRVDMLREAREKALDGIDEEYKIYTASN